MKTTLAQYFAHPLFDVGYNRLSTAAIILQTLLESAVEFREKGRWGSSGPTEWLSGYGGCVNCIDHHWHSSRDGLKTYAEHLRQIFYDTLESVSMAHMPGAGYDSFNRWRDAHGIGFSKVIKRRMVESSREDEMKAWAKLIALEGAKLCDVSLNRCHRGVNVGKGVQLCIGSKHIWVTLQVTNRTEYRQLCGSSWSWSSLTGQKYPTWKPGKESFAAFLERAATEIIAKSIPDVNR